MSAARAAALWHRVPGDTPARLARCVDRALAAAAGPVEVFFRADDVAAPGENFRRLLEAFSCRRVPLNLAVVPAWLTAARWRALSRLAANDCRRWCGHQHGWRHANHEAEGRKQEFGPSRPGGDLEADLARGRRRLEEILGTDFTPVFTPPWNRCDGRTLEALARLGYRAVSRRAGARPPAPPGLPDLAVDVDLHTRREPEAAAGWRGLLHELEAGLAGGRCGVMIHHRRMNAAALEFIDGLLALLGRRSAVRWVDFRDLGP